MRKEIIIASISAALMFGSIELYQYGEMRMHKTMRDATMVDTGARHSSSKGNYSYNVYGYFIDKQTGLHFTDSIGDSLYRQFERDGNKAIAVKWQYDIDKVEQTSRGIFAKLFSFIGAIGSCFGFGIAAHSYFIRRTKDSK